MQWVSPEMNMRGIGFNSKAIQVPASQTKHFLMGTRHKFCPLGLKHNVARAIKMDIGQS